MFPEIEQFHCGIKHMVYEEDNKGETTINRNTSYDKYSFRGISKGKCNNAFDCNK